MPHNGSGLPYYSQNIILKAKAWQVSPQPLLEHPLSSPCFVFISLIILPFLSPIIPLNLCGSWIVGGAECRGNTNRSGWSPATLRGRAAAAPSRDTGSRTEPQAVRRPSVDAAFSLTASPASQVSGSCFPLAKFYGTKNLSKRMLLGQRQK